MNDFDFSCFTDGFGDFNGDGKVDESEFAFLDDTCCNDSSDDDDDFISNDDFLDSDDDFFDDDF